MGVCKGTSKCLVGITSAIFLIVGITLLFLGMTVLNSYKDVGNIIYSSPYTMIPVVALFMVNFNPMTFLNQLLDLDLNK